MLSPESVHTDVDDPSTVSVDKSSPESLIKFFSDLKNKVPSLRLITISSDAKSVFLGSLFFTFIEIIGF